jgi:hypothetical protein
MADCFTRFRGLRTAVHHRPPLYLNWADRRAAFAGERPRTGVNETKTETRRWAAGGQAVRVLGGPR